MKPGVPGIFVTGTGTGIGKSVLSAAIVAQARAAGIAAIGLKPLLTGLDEAPDPTWPPDHELLARVCDRAASELTGFTFGPPVSPHLAAELAGRKLELGEIVAWVDAAAAGHEAVVVEGVGGLLVPLGPDLDVADLAVALALPVVIAAHPGLGTINHTRLTVEAARRRGLKVRAVVLGPWPEDVPVIERSNRETIAELCEVEVLTLPHVRHAVPEALAAAARSLPVRDWLAPRS